MRTIVNMVDQLTDEFEFWIVTLDRDLGDKDPYPGIEVDKWLPVGKAMVCYLSPRDCTVRKIGELLKHTRHDVLYLNSFFEPLLTIKTLLARRLSSLPSKHVILAPRGEFSPGALEIKYFKKSLYIKVAKMFGIYNGILWQASSDHEALDIARVMNLTTDVIQVAPDLPSPILSDKHPSYEIVKAPESQRLRIVFLSRISPKKNLDYAIKILAKIKSPVLMDIYGPIEDDDYWQTCRNMWKAMPAHIGIEYNGSIQPEAVASVFSQYDLFFFPTRGENYGHVIAEALSAGTSVLLSDQTPWRNLERDQLGWDFSLDDRDKFIDVIEKLAATDYQSKKLRRTLIKQKITLRLADPVVVEANRKLFQRVVQSG